MAIYLYDSILKRYKRICSEVFLLAPFSLLLSNASQGSEIQDITYMLVVDHSTGGGPQLVPLLIKIWKVYTLTGHMLLRHVTEFSGPSYFIFCLIWIITLKKSQEHQNTTL